MTLSKIRYGAVGVVVVVEGREETVVASVEVHAEGRAEASEVEIKVVGDFGLSMLQ
jgi:hypothetical protein